jgi:ABC-type polysaccharide/polyol phosphate transport system ATPase subunit
MSASGSHDATGPVVDARNVTVEFRTPHFKTATFKEWVFNRLKGRGGYRTFRALKDARVEVGRGESVALLGHNGSGKSTLLKVIAGIIDPPGARVRVNGRIAPMIELSAGFDGELSGRENIVLSCTLMGLSPREISDRMEGIIDFAELRDFIEMPFKNYSSGMQARLGFACATAVDPDIILADEVLAVGDANFSRKCLNRIAELKARGASVILVSHDASAIRLFCDRAYVFEEGVILFEGDVHTALGIHEESLERRGRKAEAVARTRAEEAAARGDLGKAATGTAAQALPGVGLTHAFLQDSARLVSKGEALGTAQSNTNSFDVDVARAFDLAFTIDSRDDHLFEGNTTLGFTLLSTDGTRVCGHESVFERPAVAPDARGLRQRVVAFRFETGLAELAAGGYRLMAQVRDRSGARLVFLQELGEVRISNSRAGENATGDIIPLAGKVSALPAT